METIINLAEQDKNNVHQFLDYMAIYPNAVVRFHASDNILRADNNTSYLTKLQTCSRAAGIFSLGVHLQNVHGRIYMAQYMSIAAFKKKLPLLQQKQKLVDVS